MKTDVPKEQLLELIRTLEKENRPYHFYFEKGSVYLNLDGIEASLKIAEPPISDLERLERPHGDILVLWVLALTGIVAFMAVRFLH